VSRYGSVPVGTAAGTPREGALMVPVRSRSSTSSPDEPGLRPDSPVATLAAKEPVCPPAPAPSPHTFELRCADSHPAGRAAVLRAERAGDAVVLARGHGARVHGFAPVLSGPERLAVIAAAIELPGGEIR
jgi:hypothetical protein